MRRPQIGFLPAFFVSLGIVFAVAVVVRIRSYERQPLPAGAASADSVLSPDPAGMTPASSDTATTIVPDEEVRADANSPLRRGFGPSILQAPNATAPAALVVPAAPAATPRTQPRVEPARTTVTAPMVPRLAPPTRPPASTSQAVSEPAPKPAQPRRDDRAAQAGPEDLTSDTTAPRLVGLEFTPAEVRDGEQTLLTVEATDDLSGVRSISGTIVAPTGASQGFACQRQEGTNRYVARVSVPKDAAAGTWQIQHLSMLDNASNIGTFSRGMLPATASFRVVSSRPDQTGPSLKGAWIDKRAVSGGEKATLFVQADDDLSGMHLISGVFVSPSRIARVGFVCRGGAQDTWECEVTIPGCADCGEWRLDHVRLEDKAHNTTTVRSESQIVAAIRVNVSSQACDATPPEVRAVVLDTDSISNTQPGVITISATLTDDACGVLSVSGQAIGPSVAGAPLHFFLSPAGDPQTWVGKLNTPAMLARGDWRIARLQVVDKGQNLKAYTSADPVLAGAVFRVE